MLHIFVHLYIHKEKEALFREYETAALTVFRKYGGHLAAACQPNEQLSTPTQECPFEIHYLQIENQKMFDQFRADPAHQSLTELRQTCIRKTELYFSTTEITYPHHA